jgi:peptidoglycan hydrolase-like protein with peptidoglycan-binding domain
MAELINVPGSENVNTAFKDKVIRIAAALQTDPNFLMAIMSFETGASFSPSQKSFSGSGATGLIQFMPRTARDLGTSIAALERMSAIEQLDFVEKYFRQFRGRLQTLEDAYMAVLFPRAIGRGPGFVLFRRPSRAYTQNGGLDLNGNGEITAAEATSRVRQRTGLLEPRNVGVTPQPVLTPTVAILARGNNSPEVGVLQDELIELGYMTLVDKQTGPNTFGRRTEEALKSFQRDNEIDQTGVYDATTQAAIQQLNNGVRLGSEGGVVLPMQKRLQRLGLITQSGLDTGRGIFGPRTQTALTQFQLNRGIRSSGVLDGETYIALYRSLPRIPVSSNGGDQAISFVLPPGGEGEGYTVYSREPEGRDQVGTQATIRALQDLGREWARLHPQVLIQFGDISRPGGGRFFNARNPSGPPDHKGHRRGIDVDIRPIRKDRALAGTDWHNPEYDPILTRALVELIRRKFPRAVVLFNDPKFINAGLTSPEAGHDNHLHLGFR